MTNNHKQKNDKEDLKSTVSMLHKRQTPNFEVEKNFPITGGPEMSLGGEPGGN